MTSSCRPVPGINRSFDVICLETIFFSPLDDKYSGAVGISKKLRTVSYEFGIRIPFWFIRD